MTIPMRLWLFFGFVVYCLGAYAVLAALVG